MPAPLRSAQQFPGKPRARGTGNLRGILPQPVFVEWLHGGQDEDRREVSQAQDPICWTHGAVLAASWDSSPRVAPKNYLRSSIHLIEPCNIQILLGDRSNSLERSEVLVGIHFVRGVRHRRCPCHATVAIPGTFSLVLASFLTSQPEPTCFTGEARFDPVRMKV